MWSKFKDIPVDGDPIIEKANHTSILYFENVDGFIFPERNINKSIKIPTNKNIYYFCYHVWKWICSMALKLNSNGI